MKVGWLQDPVHYVGGAEMTCQEFRNAVPEGVEIVDCPPGGVETGLDRYVAHNVVHYKPDDVMAILRYTVADENRVSWFHHDLSPWIDPEVKTLMADARHIFCSPLQRDKYGAEGVLIPPALDLDRFKPPRQSRKRRKGTCSIAQWRNHGKGAFLLAEWADKNGEVDVYGEGDYAPFNRNVKLMGPVPPEKVPQTLWKYEAFVFLPLETEPFGRAVAEAHAAGCRVITNRKVGATWWLQNEPEALRTAAADFWAEVLR